MRLAFAVSALVLLPLTNVSGQGLDIAPGARVRVTSTAHGYNRDVATVSQVRGDTVVLLFGGKPSSVAITDLNQVQVSAGTRTTVGRNMLLGGLAGFVGGAILGFATYEECDGCWFAPQSAEGNAALLGVTLGVVGSAVGGILGAFNRTERWESANLARARVSVAPALRGGVQVSMTRSF